MTNNWVDIKNADVILVMGGNPAENHPCGFKWAIEAKKTRNAKLICVDPRFNRTAAVSDLYVPIRAGTDIAFLAGVINYMLANDRVASILFGATTPEQVRENVRAAEVVAALSAEQLEALRGLSA